MKSLSPHVLRLNLKKVIKQIELEDKEDAIMTLMNIHNALEQYSHMYLDDLKETIDHHLVIAEILLYVNVYSGAIEQIKQIMALLYPIFMKNLWMTSRLLAPITDSKSLGTLYDLPEGIRFCIYQELYDAL